jgi:hypothetical protein
MSMSQFSTIISIYGIFGSNLGRLDLLADYTIMPQYNINFGSGIRLFGRIWVVFVLISSLVAYAAASELILRTELL